MKFRIKNVKGALNAAKRLVDEALIDAREKVEVFAVNRIVGETRRGKDLRNGGKQPDLSESYINLRSRIKSGKVKVEPAIKADVFRPRVSNLTLTGQLLNSVNSKINQLKQIEIFVDGSREDVKITDVKSGKEIVFRNSKKFKTNKGLAQDLAKRGRYFLGMDAKGIRNIRKIVLDEIRRRKIKVKRS